LHLSRNECVGVRLLPNLHEAAADPKHFAHLHAKEMLAVKISICKNNPPSLVLKTFQPSTNRIELSFHLLANNKGAEMRNEKKTEFLIWRGTGRKWRATSIPRNAGRLFMWQRMQMKRRLSQVNVTMATDQGAALADGRRPQCRPAPRDGEGDEPLA
jgi:hypothetical protein